jgi:hypothetical protein
MLASTLLILVGACGDDAAPLDAGRDSGARDGGSRDAAPADSGSIDAAPIDASEHDGGADASTADAGTTCAEMGGACVPVVPGSCPSGRFGDPASCGGGVGVTCCLPAEGAPVCLYVGEKEEGWYTPSGERVCLASCAGAIASCEAIGTRSEGWYAPSESTGCGMFGELIMWTDCG